MFSFGIIAGIVKFLRMTFWLQDFVDGRWGWTEFCWFLRSVTSQCSAVSRSISWARCLISWSFNSKGQSMIWIICKSKCTTSCNLVFGGAYNADKSNLVKLATKSVCVPLRVRRNCYVRTPVHHSLCQRSLMPCGVLGGTCANAIPSGVCVPLRFAVFMHLSQYMLGVSVGNPVWSTVFCCPHAHGSLMLSL